MRPFIVESGVAGDQFSGFGIRRINVKGFKNVFLLARMFVEDTRYYKYVVMDETTGKVLVSARSVHSVLYELHHFLKPMEQCDLEMFINKDYL